MAKDNVTWQPKWVPLSILDFARIVHNFGNDNDSLANWVRKMAEDLLFCNTDSEDELTKDMLTAANEKYSAKSEAGKKGGKASAKARANKKKSKEVAGNGNAPGESSNGLEEYYDQEPDEVITNGDAARREAADGESDGNVVSNRTTVSNPAADGDIREDSLNVPEGRNAVMMESGTSAAGDSFDEARQSQTGAGAPSVREKSCLEAPAPQGSRRGKPKRPKNAAEVVAWAADHGIDEVDARDWYELNFVIRPGCDKDGAEIENWPGHCISYCRAVKEKRESA